MSRNSINRLPLFVPYTSGTSEAGPSSSLVNVSIPLLIHGDFPCGSAGKESACNAGNLGSIPGFGRSPGEGKVYPLQYSGLENSMDYSSGGRKELDTTEKLSLSLSSNHEVLTYNDMKNINLVYDDIEK